MLHVDGYDNYHKLAYIFFTCSRRKRPSRAKNLRGAGAAKEHERRDYTPSTASLAAQIYLFLVCLLDVYWAGTRVFSIPIFTTCPGIAEHHSRRFFEGPNIHVLSRPAEHILAPLRHGVRRQG